MLDANIDKLFSIETQLPNQTNCSSKVLLLRACNVYILEDNRIYSELEEQTFDPLNKNSGCGILDIEFAFENNIVSESYPEFYTKCFVIRTDTKVIIKPMKSTNYPHYSKINPNGELVVGIRYFFNDKRDKEKIMSCKSILVEGFIALGNVKNVFGIMCQLQKNESGWGITTANTYQPKYAKNIKYLID